MVVAPGFGWSAGDIAAAVNILVKVGKAFRTVGGAAARFQDASAFLHSLRVTLDHVAAHAGGCLNEDEDDVYAADIREQLARIAGPWTAFEAFVLKYEAALGAEEGEEGEEGEGEGHGTGANVKTKTTAKVKLARVPRTVQFALKDLAGEIDRLRLAAAQPLQVVNTLLALQLVHETRLVPQRLFNAEQCSQLVDAIQLAGVGGELSRRLEGMEENYRALVNGMRDEVMDHVTKTTSAMAARPVHTPPPQSVVGDEDDSSTQNSVSSSTSASLGGDGARELNDGADPPMSLRDFRLLVEDQHWSVVRLVQAMQAQLECIKLDGCRNSPVVLTDRTPVMSGRSQKSFPTAVAKSASTLIATMTTGITTGVIVGKATAVAQLAPADAGAGLLSSSSNISHPSGGDGLMAQSQIDQRGSESDGHRTEGDHLEEIKVARDSRAASIADADEKSKVDQKSEQNRRPEVTEKSQTEKNQTFSRPQSPIRFHDSVSGNLWSNAQIQSYQFVGSKDEQTVVKFCPPPPDDNKPRSESIYRVPECTEKDWQDRHAFFVPGRVFMTLWTATGSNVLHANDGRIQLHQFVGPHFDGNSSHVELRRFLVVQNEGPYSLCVPIYLRTSKSSARQPYECLISMDVACEGDDDWVGRDEDRFLVTPTANFASARVNRDSVVKLRQTCMVDHGVKVVDIGVVGEDDLTSLLSLWHDANDSEFQSWFFGCEN